MEDELEWWLFGGDLYERRLRGRITAAQSAADYAAASAAADRREMAAKLQQQSGSLQAQIDKLTKAFIAFVEYEDIRGELGQYAAEGTVRRHARELVGRRLGRDIECSPAPPDVPGYWLAPAARSLDPANLDAAADLATATSRDPRRTAAFLTLVAALSKDPALAEPYAAGLLPKGSEVSRVERAVWTEAAAGRLGEAARATLEATLGRVLAAAPADVVRSWVAAGATRSTGLSQEAGAAGLARLRERLESVPGEADEVSSDVLGLVAGLVDEGAPGEAEILARMREVRSEMGFVAEQSGATWDTAAGDVVELLLGDVSSADPDLRRVAQRVLARRLEEEADRLLAEASAPAPEEEQLDIEQERVTLRSTGPTDSGLEARVFAAAERAYAPPSWIRPVAYVCIGLAVVLLILMVVHWAFALLAAAVGGAGAWLLVVRHPAEVRARDAQVKHRVDWLHGRLDKATAALVDKQARAAKSAKAALVDREAIAGALRSVGDH